MRTRERPRARDARPQKIGVSAQEKASRGKIVVESQGREIEPWPQEMGEGAGEGVCRRRRVEARARE